MELQVAHQQPIDERTLLLYREPEESLSPRASRKLVIMRRRIRVAILIKEEGLRRGTIARIADWLNVSPSTIRRDIHILIADGDLLVNRDEGTYQNQRRHGVRISGT